MTNSSPAAPPAGSLKPTDALGYAEAGELIGRSADTVERDRKKGKYPGAFQDPARADKWFIPIADLVAAGRLDPSLVEQAEQELAARRESREVRELRERVIRLEEQLAAALHAAAVADHNTKQQHKLLELLAKKVG